MSQIGFGALIDHRRVQRTPKNPLDKTTIVSIFPKAIHEKKETIEPGFFNIEPGSYDRPSLLVVGTSSWWRDIDPEQPMIEIPVSSIVVADSVIKDWANGLFMCDMGESMPGLFFLPGEKSLIEVKTNYRGELERAHKRQRNWYHKLVEAGDILWARSGGNPISISDDMRLAAQELGIKDKSWMADFSTIQMTECKACGQLVKPGFPICANCKTIVNMELYKQLELQQAQ